MAPATFFYEKNEAFEQLAAGKDAIFESRTRFLVFAASVGHARDRRVPDPDDNGEMRWSYISDNNRLSVIVAALTYADKDDAEVILNPEAQIDTLISYGAGGARIIQEEVVDEPGQNLDNLVSFLQEHRDVEALEQQVGILEEIEKEVSSLRGSSDD
jgi:hypothetical protein